MRQRSSIRETFITAEEGKKTYPPPLPPIDFDGQRLKDELLSLGNPKITMKVAELIAQEVEKELLSGSHLYITAEVVSDLVRFKLEKLGLIEIRSLNPRPRSLKKTPSEKSMKTQTPPTVRQPNLRMEAKPLKSRPQKLPLAWSEEGRQAFLQLPLMKGGGKWEGSDPEIFLTELCRRAAAVESSTEEPDDPESTSLHFFNHLASLDFLPGLPLLRSDVATGRVNGAFRGISFDPTKENIYSLLDRMEPNPENSVHTTLGFLLGPSQRQGNDEAKEAIELFLKLLKARLSHHSQKSGFSSRQDLYFELSSPEKSPSSFSPQMGFKPLGTPPSACGFDWNPLWAELKSLESVSFFSLSLGVSGLLWDLAAEKTKSAAQTPADSKNLDLRPGLENPQGENPPVGSPAEDLSTIAGFTQFLADSLKTHPSLRVFFLNRSEEKTNTPLVDLPRVPTPTSADLLYSGEIRPTASLNLAAMVEEEEISWNRLRRAARQAVLFLDNMIDRMVYPTEASEAISKANRSLSLGLMGWADLLYLLRIPYNSDEAVDLAGRLAQFIQEEAVAASSELAKTRGVFPNYIGSHWQKRGIPIRNAHLTGLVWDPIPSNIAQVAPGIEPHSILVAQGETRHGKPHYLVHPFLAEVAQKRGFSTEPLLRKIVEGGSLQAVEEIPEDVRKVFVNYDDVDWEWHLRMAHAFEKHFDHGVAKLCPVPFEGETPPLKEILEMAHDLRLGSLFLKRRGEAVFSPAQKSSVPPSSPSALAEGEDGEQEEVTQVNWLSCLDQGRETADLVLPRRRPETLTGSTYKFKTACGNLYVTINNDEEGPFELFAQVGKSNGCTFHQNEAISRLVSLGFRCGVSPEEVTEQLKGIPCSPTRSTEEGLLSCSDAIAEAIALHAGKKIEKAPQTVAASEPVSSSPKKETPFSIFDEVVKAQDATALLSPRGEPWMTAACEECGRPFKKLNGSLSCPECKNISL